MRWVLLALTCVAAVVAVNIALLSSSTGTHHDPVGRLSPVSATIPSPSSGSVPPAAPPSAHPEDD